MVKVAVSGDILSTSKPYAPAIPRHVAIASLKITNAIKKITMLINEVKAVSTVRVE